MGKLGKVLVAVVLVVFVVLALRSMHQRAPDSLSIFVNTAEYEYSIDAIRSFMRRGLSCMGHLCITGLCYMPKTWPLTEVKVESTSTLMLIPVLLGVHEYLLRIPN